MICEASAFTFVPPRQVAGARRVLLKPSAPDAAPYPATTSRETLNEIICGIRKVTDADIILLERPSEEKSAHAVYRSLGYDFPRVICLDVRDCPSVEIENPLPKPFALSTFWIPSVVLSCDFLISVVPFRVCPGGGQFTVHNLLGLLPPSKYTKESGGFHGMLQRVGTDRLLADLYFTVPFDLGVIDGRLMATGQGGTPGCVEGYGKLIIDEPFEADRQASNAVGVSTDYLRLIEMARSNMLA